MGVPAFYRWLADKYPLIVVDVIEEDSQTIDGIAVPVNTAELNPNGGCRTALHCTSMLRTQCFWWWIRSWRSYMYSTVLLQCFNTVQVRYFLAVPVSEARFRKAF